jgi:uncharacterized protein
LRTSSIKILAHLSAFFAPVILPIVFLFLFRDEEIKVTSLQALIFHFLIGIAISVSLGLSIVLIGIPFLIYFAFLYVYAPIKGAIESSKGNMYYYPWIGRLFY